MSRYPAVRVISAMLIAAATMLTLCAPGAAQVPGPKQPPAPKKEKELPPVSIRFRNDTKLTIVLQGISVSPRGVQRRGQPILIREGRAAIDGNVPPGVRLITIVDYNQPSRPLLQNFPLPVAPGRDLQVLIRTDPKNPQRIVLTPDQ
ncbi:MAG: hypothetical protein L0Y71_18310 [Gemmataceae bacterium]|nr:hypothetical protein [Gemmataceae bacterium]